MTTEERLEKLERELTHAKRLNRRLMVGAAVCLGAVFAWAFIGQPGRLGAAQTEAPATAPVPKEVRARSFVLEDENGKTRAELTILKEGPALLLADENGKLRAVLSVHKEGLGLGLYDENEKRRAILGVSEDGPGLSLCDENEKTRAMMFVGKERPVMGLADEKGKLIWSAP